jgi:hypothetical protein
MALNVSSPLVQAEKDPQINDAARPAILLDR